MKKLLLLILGTLLLTSMVSAYTKTYNQENKIISIYNNGQQHITDLQLLYNSYTCGIECYAIIKIDTYQGGIIGMFNAFNTYRYNQGQWNQQSIPLIQRQLYNETSHEWNPVNFGQLNAAINQRETTYLRLEGKKNYEQEIMTGS